MTKMALASPVTDQDIVLGDWVRFTGTVEKYNPQDGYGYGVIDYREAPLPGFTGYQWVHGNDVTRSAIDTGVVVGKRRYISMANDEGIWVPNAEEGFTGYLVAYHLARNPVIVRLDQISRVEQK